MKLVEVPMTSSASAVVAGRVDGAALAEPFLGAALATKSVRSIENPGAAIASTYIISAWFMSKDYVAKTPMSSSALSASCGKRRRIRTPTMPKRRRSSHDLRNRERDAGQAGHAGRKVRPCAHSAADRQCGAL